MVVVAGWVVGTAVGTAVVVTATVVVTAAIRRTTARSEAVVIFSSAIGHCLKNPSRASRRADFGFGPGRVAGMDVERYLARIGFDAAVAVDLETLTALQRAHLSTVPFENLHVYHRLGVRTDTDWSIAKIVDQGRGGWCFENNGAFGALLEALGFDVLRLDAAVLLDGPNTVVDHLALEVALDEPWLVDVGFGESFTQPLALNRRGPQPGGNGTYELIDSSQGVTMTLHDAEGVPVPQYRFKRVHHELAEFDSASEHLQTAQIFMQACHASCWKRINFR